MPINLTQQPGRRSNPWMIGGVALAIAAVAAGALIIPDLGDDNVIDAVQTSTTSAPPTETSTTVDTVPSTDPGPTAESSETTGVPITEPSSSAIEPATAVISTGPDGVTVQPLDGSASTTVGNPARFAVAGPRADLL